MFDKPKQTHPEIKQSAQAIKKILSGPSEN